MVIVRFHPLYPQGVDKVWITVDMLGKYVCKAGIKREGEEGLRWV